MYSASCGMCCSSECSLSVFRKVSLESLLLYTRYQIMNLKYLVELEFFIFTYKIIHTMFILLFKLCLSPLKV